MKVVSFEGNLTVDMLNLTFNASNEDYAYFYDNATETFYKRLIGDDEPVPPPLLDPSVIFILDGVVLTSVSIIGLVCNFISVIVLLKPKMRGSSFNRYLATLATFDLLYLATSVMIFGLPVLSNWFNKEVFPRVLTYAYGLAHIGRVGSVFLTMAVTIERYYAIVHPFKHFRSKTILLVGSSIFAILYNIPKFFEVFFDPASKTTYQTAMRLSPYYITYYLFWSKFILVELIPYITIIVLNAGIIRSIRASKTFRKGSKARGSRAGMKASILLSRGMSNGVTTTEDLEMDVIEGDELGLDDDPAALKCHRSGSQRLSSIMGDENSIESPRNLCTRKKDINLGTVLVTISVLFVACQSVKILPDLYEVFFCLVSRARSGTCDVSPFMEAVVSVSHLLLAINSSANFIIYVARGAKFRSEVAQLCR